MKAGIALLLALGAAWCVAQSAIEVREFPDPVAEQRYRMLIRELRCTVCQNEPLESSNAPLAADLRQQVYEQILAGRSDQEIREFMRERYGDFVLYKPPLATHTLVLWLGPGVLLLIGLWTAVVVIRRHRRLIGATAPDTPAGQDRESGPR